MLVGNKNSLWSKKGLVSTSFDDAVLLLELRRIFSNWNKSILRLRRSSDNELKYIFFDGDTITLNSLVGDTSSAPSATTLGTWIGSNNAYVHSWFSQSNDNTINSLYYQLTNSLQPLFINAGVINLEAGLPAIKNDGNTYLTRDKDTVFASGNNFTIISLTANKVLSNYGFYFYTGSSIGLFLYNDNRTNKRIAIVFTHTIYGTFYIVQQNNINNKLLTSTFNGSLISSYYNGNYQSNVTYSATYTNGNPIIGKGGDESNGLNGNIQNFIVFPTDKTSDLSSIHTEINTYYSIY